LAEEHPSGGWHADSAAAKIDAVEITGEDLVLGELALDPQRDDRLAQLAGEAPLVVVEEDLDQLLRDGAAALHDHAGRNVGVRGAENGKRVDAPVTIETAILDAGDSVDEHRRVVFPLGVRRADSAFAGERLAVGRLEKDRVSLGFLWRGEKRHV